MKYLVIDRNTWNTQSGPYASAEDAAAYLKRRAAEFARIDDEHPRPDLVVAEVE